MLEELKHKVKEFLLKRRLAYSRTFNTDDKSVQITLKDLAKFCRADKSTFHEDARLHAVLEGRREVWLRIMNHLKMPTQEFLDKFGGIENE